jgi:hypothetical protein
MTSQSINPSLYQKALCISSSKGTGTPASFSLTIDLPRNNTFNKVSLIHASIPKGWYMVDSQTDLLYEDSGNPGVPITVQFPSLDVSRNYSITELCAELVVVLNAAAVSTGSGVTYTCVYNIPRSKLFLTASAGEFTVNLSEDTEQGRALIKYLGWNTANTSSSSNYDSPKRVNLQRYGCLNLRSSICNNSGDDILSELFMADTGSNDVFEFNPSDVFLTARGMANNQTNSIHVQIADDYGNAINMNGLDWQATIVCYDDRVGSRC